ncbi:MAG: adenylosuccinate synthetase, partial [Terriglobales bacterium]
PICVGYTLDGRAVEAIPAAAADWERLEPQYESLAGWQSPTEGITDYNALPQRARDYLAFLARELRLDIGLISTGPERDQTILRPESRIAQLLETAHGTHRTTG